MTSNDIISLDVCDNCVLIAANGEGHPDTEAQTQAYIDYETSVRADGGSIVLGNTDDPYFAHYACDACGTTLAGTRYDGGLAILTPSHA